MSASLDMNVIRKFVLESSNVLGAIPLFYLACMIEEGAFMARMISDTWGECRCHILMPRWLMFHCLFFAVEVFYTPPWREIDVVNACLTCTTQLSIGLTSRLISV